MAVKVLILEDNPVARSFLCRVVRESFSDEILITEAADLPSARRHIALRGEPAGSAGPHMADRFKLILVDLELPNDDGLDLLADLVHDAATKIVTTLYADDDHLLPALQCGADGYLLKEARFEVLVEELQKIVRGQPPLSPALARRLLAHFRQGAADVPSPDSGFAPQARTAPGRLAGDDISVDPERLSKREVEALTFLSKGFTTKEIASLMGIKWFNVNDHIKSIYKKLKLSSRNAAAAVRTAKRPSA